MGWPRHHLNTRRSSVSLCLEATTQQHPRAVKHHSERHKWIHRVFQDPGSLAIPQASLLTLGSKASGNYGLHPSLPNIQRLFNSNNIAFVANVGTLVQPLTPAQYQAGSAPTPTNLFSHPDQQLEWQNAAQSGVTSTGWAGRIADSMAATYNPTSQIPLITSVFGDTLFCNGAASSPVAVNPGNLQNGPCGLSASDCASRLATAQQLLTFKSGLSLVQADNGITANAYKYTAPPPRRCSR